MPNLPFATGLFVVAALATICFPLTAPVTSLTIVDAVFVTSPTRPPKNEPIAPSGLLEPDCCGVAALATIGFCRDDDGVLLVCGVCCCGGGEVLMPSLCSISLNVLPTIGFVRDDDEVLLVC